MEQVFSPLDEELALLPGTLAPLQQEHLVHLASWMPFEKAAQMMEEILSVQTTQETARYLTERTGACMQASRAGEVTCPQEARDQPSQLRCVLSADGAMVSLINKQWVEVRTLAIGEPQETLNADGQPEIHVGSLSYFSRLADAVTFTELAHVEIERRKVKGAKEVCAVMDGADWLQDFINIHRNDAVRVLDFAHAAEHVAQLLEALEKAGACFPPHLLDRCLHILKHRGPGSLLRIADRHFGKESQLPGESTHLKYLRSREALMQYRAFRHQGWPIGSGMVESANKNVVEARLKGTGMHWKRTHVNPMLELRNAICNDRWKEMWQRALKELERQQALQRAGRVQRKAQSGLEQEPGEQVSFSASQPPPHQARRASVLSSSPSRSQHGGKVRQAKPHRQSPLPCESREVKTDLCICGTTLVQAPGKSRVQRYCSPTCGSRARMRAKREREKQGISSSNSPSPQGSEGNESICICGTPFTQPGRASVNKRYCSARCAGRARMRAKRERDRQWLSHSLLQDQSSEA